MTEENNEKRPESFGFDEEFREPPKPEQHGGNGDGRGFGDGRGYGNGSGSRYWFGRCKKPEAD